MSDDQPNLEAVRRLPWGDGEGRPGARPGLAQGLLRGSHPGLRSRSLLVGGLL
jgi:hypothetical protein